MFVATLIRSTFGFGEALVAVRLLALRLPVAVAAPRSPRLGYFLPASLAGLIGYLAMGVWDSQTTRHLLPCLPAALLATFGGRLLNRRLSGERFFRYIYLGLIATGIMLIAR